MQYLLLIALFVAPTNTSARQLANYSEKELEKLWRDVGGSEQKWVTSNSLHFWAWSRNEGESYLGRLLGPKGIVIGDPHPKNVFDYRTARGKAKLAIADIDDGGKGPFILDFVRYITYLESSDLETKVGRLFDAYIAGLSGKKWDLPKLVEEAQAETAATIEGLHLRYVNKHVVSEKLDYEDLGLTPGFRLSPSKKNELRALSEPIRTMTGYEKIWDAGYRVNDSGSSAGLARFWFLVGNEKKPTKIFEAKELSRPALDLYEKQDSHERRVNSLIEAYTENGFDKKLFGLVMVKDRVYWVRPRKYQSLDMDDNHSKEEKREIAEYLAYWIGTRQAKQREGAALLRLLEKDLLHSKDLIEKVVRAYQDEMDRLGK